MSPHSTMTPAIITAMPGAGRGSPRGSRRPSPAIGAVRGSGHDTREDQQDSDRLPRPMERLPREEPCGCDAGGDECERRPQPRKIRPLIR